MPNSISSKPKRGRPKRSRLSERELARIRKRRQRAKLANEQFSKIEVFVPHSLKRDLSRLAADRTLSEIGVEAFKQWVTKELEK
jgi:hypothetical protein